MITNISLNNVIETLHENGYEADLDTITKDGYNGEAILVPVKTANGRMKAVFYPASFESEEEMEEAIRQFVDSNTAPAFDTEFLLNWETSKGKLFVGLRPQTTETAIITRPWLDLEQYLYVDVSGHGICKVTPQMLDQWGITEDLAFEVAKANVDAAASCASMSDILGFDNGVPMYVITNKTAYRGAAGILSKRILNKACDLIGSNRVVILPSSIHEVIVISEEFANSPLAGMIQEINATELAPEDILSDHPYKYAKGYEVAVMM